MRVVLLKIQFGKKKKDGIFHQREIFEKEKSLAIHRSFDFTILILSIEIAPNFWFLLNFLIECKYLFLMLINQSLNLIFLIHQMTTLSSFFVANSFSFSVDIWIEQFYCFQKCSNKLLNKNVITRANIFRKHWDFKKEVKRLEIFNRNLWHECPMQWFFVAFLLINNFRRRIKLE